MSESQAIWRASEYLAKNNRYSGRVQGAAFIPAKSTDPMHGYYSYEHVPAQSTDPIDGYYPHEQWMVHFDTGLPDFEPHFFVMAVNFETGVASDVEVM
jgi:hypothetical protein